MMASQFSGSESRQMPARVLALVLVLAAVLAAGCGGGGGSGGSGQPDVSAPAAPPPAVPSSSTGTAGAGDAATSTQIPRDQGAADDAIGSDAASDPAEVWDDNPLGSPSNSNGSSVPAGVAAGAPPAVSATPTETGNVAQADTGLGNADGATSTETVGTSEATAGTITVTWIPPTTRVDGSVLDDLAGYRIYCDKTVDGSMHVVPVDDPAATVWTVDGLAPGTWRVRMTALDSRGRESDYSNTATTTLP